MVSVSQEMIDKFLNFINKCNTETLNSNDYNIVHAIFHYIGYSEFPYIDQLADEANVSKASVSRFIKKYDFENYQDFKLLMSSQASLLFYNLRVRFLEESNRITNDKIANLVYQRVMDNIIETKKNLDLEKLEGILALFEISDDITFVGDEHDLVEFYMLQLALLTSGKAAYLFKVNETKEIHSNYFTEKSMVVMVNVANQFFHYNDILDKANKVNAKVVYMSQDYNEDIAIKCDITYIYGIAGTVNYGYNSLFYIGELLEKLYINR